MARVRRLAAPTMVRMSAAEAEKVAFIDRERVAATTEAEIEQHAREDDSAVDVSKLKPRNRRKWPAVEDATALISRAHQPPPVPKAQAEVINLSDLGLLRHSQQLDAEATKAYRSRLIAINKELINQISFYRSLDAMTMSAEMFALAAKCDDAIRYLKVNFENTKLATINKIKEVEQAVNPEEARYVRKLLARIEDAYETLVLPRKRLVGTISELKGLILSNLQMQSTHPGGQSLTRNSRPSGDAAQKQHRGCRIEERRR